MEIDRKNLNDEEDELDEKPGRLPIRGLHYQHTFSYEEVNALIEGVLFSRTLDTKTANQMVGKTEETPKHGSAKKAPRTSALSVRPFSGTESICGRICLQVF